MGEGSSVVLAPDNEARFDPHKELKRALGEYCHFPHSQGFAVMLNGAWGSGKTRFIQDCANGLVRERPGEVLKPLYVSLYGVSETSEIDELLFQQLHPILNHKATRLAGAVLRGIGKFALKVDLGQIGQLTGTVPEVNLSSMLARAEGRVVIFDDFERALMEPAAILGYINPLVEHEDCKVIIIADESQLDQSKRADYDKRKEKTIGRTFQFEPDTQSVYDSFLKDIDNEGARSFLEESKKALLQVFSDSQLNNLRLLKQLLWDSERIWKVLTPDQRAHKVAMQELVTLLCAAALELRSGRLNESEFQFVNLAELVFSEMGRVEAKPNPMDCMTERYPTVRFDSALLDPDTICNCVLRSRVVKESIQEQLRRHPYFASPHDGNPSWKLLWLSYEVAPEEQDELVRRFEADFDARRFDDQGIIYHVIGLSLWLAHLGYPNWPGREVENKVRRYIDDVYARRDASFEDAFERDMLDTSMGSFGFGYKQNEDLRFGDLVRYERKQREAWRKLAYPALAAHLQQLAKDDSQTFLREVCFTNAGPSRFAKIGVLRLIPADQFAAAIAAAPYRDQKEIAMALSIRYEQAQVYRELRDELPWLREVNTHLREAATTLPRIAQGALLSLARHYVDETIEKVSQISRSTE